LFTAKRLGLFRCELAVAFAACAAITTIAVSDTGVRILDLALRNLLNLLRRPFGPGLLLLLAQLLLTLLLRFKLTLHLLLALSLDRALLLALL